MSTDPFSLLADSIKSKRISQLEKKRLFADLKTVYDRLQKKEYQKFSYTRNKFDVPDRTLEIYTELEFLSQLGHSWESILKTININSFRKVVDICPGFTPKIELGLFYSNYTGEVVVIDKDIAPINQLIKLLNLFNPKFKITKKVADLFNLKKESYDLVLANHTIDDLTLFYFSKKLQIPLKDIYEKEGEFIRIWNYILANKEENQKEILTNLNKLFNNITHPGSIICITQYKSYMEKLLDMDKATSFTQEVFRDLIKTLSQENFLKETALLNKAFKTSTGHIQKNSCVILKRKNL